MPNIADMEVGLELPTLRHRPDNVQSFMYNAALWNAHRIHFDLPYAQNEEGYPGIVIAGPLMGDWLAQCVEHWLGDSGGMLKSIEYSNRQAAYVGETLTSSGQVADINVARNEVTLTLGVINEQGDVITPGTAVVSLG